MADICSRCMIICISSANTEWILGGWSIDETRNVAVPPSERTLPACLFPFRPLPIILIKVCPAKRSPSMQMTAMHMYSSHHHLGYRKSIQRSASLVLHHAPAQALCPRTIKQGGSMDAGRGSGTPGPNTGNVPLDSALTSASPCFSNNSVNDSTVNAP